MEHSAPCTAGAPVAAGNVIGYDFDCVDAEARVTCELTWN